MELVNIAKEERDEFSKKKEELIPSAGKFAFVKLRDTRCQKE